MPGSGKALVRAENVRKRFGRNEVLKDVSLQVATGEVLGVIADLAETGMTMVVVTHEMAFARQVSNRVVLMESGRVDCEADPETFFRDQPSPRLKAFLATIH